MTTKKDEQSRQWQKWKWKSTNDVRRWTIFCYWQVLKTICSYWQMLNRTSNFGAFLFDRRVYDVIEMKKMRKTSSVKDKQKSADQQRWLLIWLCVWTMWFSQKRMSMTWSKKMLLMTSLIERRRMTISERRRRKSSTERRESVSKTENSSWYSMKWLYCVLANWWTDKVFNDYYWWFDLYAAIMLMWIKRMNCKATEASWG